MQHEGYVCDCMMVDRDRLRAAFEGGDGSLEDVIRRTRATGGCGTCQVKISRLLRQWRVERRVKRLLGRR